MIKFINVSNYIISEEFYFLKDVSFEVADGEIAYLVHNTLPCFLTEMFKGHYYPKAGDIVIDGIEIKKDMEPPVGIASVIGIVDHDEFKLISDKTIYENVDFAAMLLGINKKNRRKVIPKLISYVNLTDDINSLAKELTPEKKQRVVFARALIKDLPTYAVNLSLGNSIELRSIMDDLSKKGKTIIAYIHESEVVKEDSWLVGKRLIRIKNGNKINDGLYPSKE